MLHTHKAKVILIMVIVVAGIVFGASLGSSKGRIISTEQGRAPIQILSHAALEPFEVKDLVKKAKYVVMGTVTTTYPSRWNTPDGTLPPNTTVENIPPDRIIITDVEFKVERVLKGPQSISSLRVRTFGGQVGQDTMIADAAPKFEVNQKYLLFLLEDDALTAQIGPEHYLVLGSVQGSFQIKGEQAASAYKELPLRDLMAQVQQYIR